MPMVSVHDGIPSDGSLNVWVLRLQWLIVQAPDVGQVDILGDPEIRSKQDGFFRLKRKVYFKVP